ncbi:MAG: hypothetical protein CMO01_13725 [Thalassobius sp.]|nr:hypothetical protein [Thalassovita sp.]
MKIRSKITLVFTLLTGSLLAIIFILVFFFSYQYTEKEFFRRLFERAYIIGQSYLEKDEVSEQIYDQILKKHYQILPEEEEAVFQVNVSRKTIDKRSNGKYSDKFIEMVFKQKHAEQKFDDGYRVGILYTDNEGDFIVVVSANNPYGEAKMNNLRNILMVAFVSSLFVIYLFGRYYAGKVLKPISKITRRANEITATNLHLRIDTGNKKDELAELAITFNSMLDRLEISFDQQNNFVNNASHELKNPLAVILGETEVTLNKERSAEEYKEALRTVEKEAQRLELLVNSLLKLAQVGHKNEGLMIESVRIDELVIEAKDALDSSRPENNILFDFSDLPDRYDELVVTGNHNLLKVALTNILDNACKFSMNQEVIVKVTVLDSSVEISIKDKGVGVPADAFKNISEPFFRAPNVRGIKGFGIGLSLSQRIINLHRGKLLIDSELEKGTEVKIIIPIHLPKFLGLKF